MGAGLLVRFRLVTGSVVRHDPKIEIRGSAACSGFFEARGRPSQRHGFPRLCEDDGLHDLKLLSNFA